MDAQITPTDRQSLSSEHASSAPVDSGRRRRTRALTGAAVVLALSALGAAGACQAVDRLDAGADISQTLEGSLRTVSEAWPGPVVAAAEESEDGAPATIHQVDTEEPVIFVTIDDGHHPSQEALEIVREQQMPVSLFLNEDPVRHHASYFEEFVELGNSVHTHTRTHLELPRHGVEEQREEICGMVDVLEDTFDDGAVGSLLRAPYGASDESTVQAAEACDITAIPHWSGTAEDGAVTLAHGETFRPGDIILTHFTQTLPEDLRAIQEKAEAEGFTIARLEDHL